jgi:hypothetical protein
MEMDDTAAFLAASSREQQRDMRSYDYENPLGESSGMELTPTDEIAE